jgi:Bacterial regulatory proteins, tetR family
MALAREYFKKRSRPRRRPDDAGEALVRERILSAAFGAFMERGYSGASTLEIATRAKVSKCRASAIVLHHLHSSGPLQRLLDQS